MVYLPRGIAPDLLVSQVKNTMPYLFKEEMRDSPLGRFPPSVVVIQEAQRDVREKNEPLSHFEYFKLCLSSHFLTCGTPVPTDVDNQIRRKLWPAQLPLEVALKMADWVLESRRWDFNQVSSRFVFGASGSAWQSESISGHLGEWFTLSSAAYGALSQYKSSQAEDKRQRVFENIRDEVQRHSEIFGSLWRANEGIACLKASAIVAHNFGDLDRVMDMWELSVADPLRLEFYKLAVSPFDSNRKLRYLGRLWVAGELYKSIIEGSSMALENHRHFALRKPRCLRQSSEYLIPMGPFFDDWGKKVAKRLKSSEDPHSDNVAEVVSALKSGWDRLPKTVGYGRALRSLQQAYPDVNLGPVTKAQEIVLNTPQESFEKRWNEEALKWMEEIPSTAKA